MSVTLPGEPVDSFTSLTPGTLFNRIYTLSYVMFRLRLPEIFTPDQVYIKNGYLLMVNEKYANSKVRDMSLGEIARMVRELVIEHSRRETILDHLQWKFDNAGAVQVPAPAGERVMCKCASIQCQGN
jgi:hypothetical protein